MDFRTQIEIESKVVEGCKFTVRFLNRRQALELESTIVETREKLAALQETMRNSSGEDVTIVDGVEQRKWRVNPGSEADFRRADLEWARLLFGVVNPAYIRAGLVSIEGYTIDGKVPDAGELASSGMDLLVQEVADACTAHSRMSDDEQKNLLSPTTLPAGDGTAHPPLIARAA